MEYLLQEQEQEQKSIDEIDFDTDDGSDTGELESDGDDIDEVDLDTDDLGDLDKDLDNDLDNDDSDWTESKSEDPQNLNI